MNTKSVIAIVFICILLGSTPVFPTLGSVQEAEGTASIQDSDHSIQAEVYTNEVTLRIIGPDGLPTEGAYVNIYQSSPTFDPVYIYALGQPNTDSNGELTVNLPLGTYLVQVINPFGGANNPHPKYLALCYISITGENVINLDVRPYVLPVTLEVINPLEGRPFSDNGGFTIQDNLGRYAGSSSYEFITSEPGKAQIYIPKNTKFDVVYRDEGYFLYKSGVQARSTNSNIQFDASKTGFLQYVITKPSSNFLRGSSLSIVFNNVKGYKDEYGTPLSSQVLSNGTAISTGSYQGFVILDGTSTSLNSGFY